MFIWAHDYCFKIDLKASFSEYLRLKQLAILLNVKLLNQTTLD